ncbi:hypothetical protein IFM89_030843 [Coptis chinensis]|uniref:FAD linked oxidase N-terminal domain-containing protein n=1 Tax=Coptis chinensis TaxID=261450 RepID=A0A835LD31_9MAGN|nr:hypothetical protein IFM89_030843 [Coptis chinensis]
MFCSTSSSTDESFFHCLNASLQIYSLNTTSYSSLLSSYHETIRTSSFRAPKPFVIVTPNLESGIQAALLCSKKHGFEIRMRSGGRDSEGLSTTSNVPFIIIDLVNFRKITIDMDDETAWLQAGAFPVLACLLS